MTEKPDLSGADVLRRPDVDSATLEVVEETARIDVVDRLTGRVTVAVSTGTFEERVRKTVESTTVEVKRVQFDREIAPGEPIPVARQEGTTTIVPVFEEVMVVERRLVLREEIHLVQHVTQEDVDVPVTLRRQDAVVTREPVGDDGTAPHAARD